MKFATVCVTHIPMNGGTKHQVYLAKNLVARGHEFHFFLQHPNRPNWIDTEGIHYHPINEVYNHNGDYIISNWYVTSHFLQDKKIKDRWKNRILIIHDVPTSNNKNECLYGDHKLMAVSETLAAISTSIYRCENRMAPKYVHCGVNPEIFNSFNRSINNQVVVGIVGKSGERGGDYRGIDEARQICNSLNNIKIMEFTADTEQGMANCYKKCNFLMELPLLAGCPTCVVESLSCGTPPITTYQGTTHLVKDGINGIILPKSNVEHCIKVLNSCLSLEYYEKIKNNINYKDLSWSSLCDKFLYNIGV